MEHGDPSLWMTAGRALEQYLGMVDDALAETSPDGWIALSGLPIPETNMAYVAPGSTSLDRAVTRFVQMARDRSVPLLLLIPEAIQPAVGEALGRLGAAPAGAIPLMSLDTARAGIPPSQPVAVRRATEPENLEACCELIADAFGLPEAAIRAFIPARIFESSHSALHLATHDGQPVSTVLASRLGDRLGLRFMATAPRHQGKGAGRALLNAIVTQYRDQGVRTIYLGTTEAGFRLYQQSGFEVVEETPVWVAMP